jgi:2-polyprenyl-6-methoxyphenol hydroxylase-like FAD-dependent oxidoreductase
VSPSTIAGVRAAARDLLAPAFREVVQKTPRPFFQPIQDLACPRLVHGRVVLLGDAAFVARPHCGMGITKAAEDAASLVAALSDASDLDEALRGWERDRIAYGRWIVAHASQLGACLQAGAPGAMPAAELARHVMRTTAVSLTEIDRRSMAVSISNSTWSTET